MHLSMLLDMAADGFGDRVAVGSKNGGLTYAGLREQARASRRLGRGPGRRAGRTG